jgi:hypothetical protein
MIAGMIIHSKNTLLYEFILNIYTMSSRIVTVKYPSQIE